MRLLSERSQQKCHIVRKGQHLVISSYVVIAQFNGTVDMILLRMRQNCFCTLDVSACRLYFHKRAFTLIADHEIHFQAGVLMKVIYLAAHLGKNIGNQIFKDSTLVSVKISLKNIVLGTIFQHTDSSITMLSISREPENTEA